MVNNLVKTWNDIALNWNKWKAPLRPSPEDIKLFNSQIDRWHQHLIDNIFSKPVVTPKMNVLLLGVTPEIANMKFPFDIKMIAVDKSVNMAQHVWPGNIPNKRTVMVDDWLTMKIEPQSQDLVLADGSFVFFKPAEMSRLAGIIAKILKPDGVFIIREFIAPDQQETLDMIADDLKHNRVANFHAYKFRVAMAIQKSFSEGVSQNDIWSTIVSLTRFHPQHSFSPPDLETGRVYKGKSDRLYFPTIDEFCTILREQMPFVTVKYPTYDFGDRCPSVTASLRVY
jgi:SAM-dependent methyltransferase